MFWAVCQSLKGRCWVITSVCWHHPTTSKQAFLLEALLYLQAQDRKVCQHPSTLLTNVANVRRWGSILLGQQRYLHNWLHLQPMEPCTNGPQEEEISICKFQAEYSCFPQTLVELSLPSVGWHRKIISFFFSRCFYELPHFVTLFLFIFARVLVCVLFMCFQDPIYVSCALDDYVYIWISARAYALRLHLVFKLLCARNLHSQETQWHF